MNNKVVIKVIQLGLAVERSSGPQTTVEAERGDGRERKYTNTRTCRGKGMERPGGGDKIEREYEGNERETDVKTEK